MLNLSAAYSKRLDSEAFGIYIEKLSKWHLSPDQWSSAVSKIIGEEETFPKLASIFPYLKSQLAPRDRGLGIETYFQMFTFNGRRYARRVNPMNQPPLPEGGSELHFVAPADKESGEVRQYPVDALVESILNEEAPF